MPWKGPGIYPAGPGQRQRKPPPERFDDQQADGSQSAGEPGTERGVGRGRSGRAAATRARKSRNRLVLGGVAAVVAVVLTVLGVLGKLPFQGSPASAPKDPFVTTYQPGDFHSVPDSCTTISAALLTQYLPGKVAQVSPSLSTAQQSQCTWTLDTRPQFRVLTVTTQAFAPSLLSAGNGSATSGAKDAYNNQLQDLRNPPKSSKAPAAQIGGTVGLGNSGFTATQVFHLGGEVNEEVTVVTRDRNVVIVVSLQGQESGGGFGPVPASTLLAGALAAAHEELAALH
jgi:cytoskeletal protein RodZ